MFYVQNTKDIIMYDIGTKVAKLVGSCSDPILSIHVAAKKTGEIEEIKEDLERSEKTWLVSAVDDSETVYVFDTASSDKRGKPLHR